MTSATVAESVRAPALSGGAAAVGSAVARLDATAPPTTRRAARLRIHFSWALAGNFCYAACQCGYLVALARLGGAAVIGQFAFAIAVAAPLFMLANLQLRAIVSTDAAGKFSFGDCVTLRMLTTGGAMLVSVGLVSCLRPPWESALAILLAVLAKACDSLSDLLYGLFQRVERLDVTARSLMLKGCLSLATLALGVALTGSAWAAALGLALSSACVLLAYDLPQALRLRACGATSWRAAVVELVRRTHLSTERGQRLLALLRYTLPLGAAMALVSLNSSLPRYWIAAELGDDELGVFASLVYFMTAGALVVDALGQTVCSRLARLHAESQRKAFRLLLAKTAGLAAAIGVAGVIGSAVAGRQVLGLFYGPTYAAHSDLLVVVMAAAGVWYLASVFGFAATASGRIRYQPAAMLAVVLVSAAGCGVLIPRCGLAGAAWSLLASSCACLGCYSILLLHSGAKS